MKRITAPRADRKEEPDEHPESTIPDVLTNHYDQLLYDWANHLAESKPKLLSTAIACDDAVVDALYSQKNERPSQRRHVIARLSSRTSDVISREHAREFCKAFEVAKPILLRENQTCDELKHTATKFINLTNWTLKALPNGPGYVQAAKWSTEAMIILLAPWSRVQLKLIMLGDGKPIQFGIVAKHPIAKGEKIYELAGQLSKDSVDDQKQDITTTSARCTHGTNPEEYYLDLSDS
ncbi:hypothetical protein B0H14DRAFT_1652065 [Mycena olivaceomarginata]|nr:hypothetical protein B0H14DRAFT_1652065 [Mycena olivaceomarginata]